MKTPWHQVSFDFDYHQRLSDVLKTMADKTFGEWDKEDDQVYDALDPASIPVHRP
jgi:hypothetical protein